MSERSKAIPLVAAGLAVAVGGAAIYGGYNYLQDKDTATTEFNIDDAEINHYCEAPAWQLDEYLPKIKNAASEPVPAIDGNDARKMNQDVADAVKSNNFALAYMDTLMKYQSEPVNFADINVNALTTLKAMQEDGSVRQKTCAFVIGNVLRTGQHVELNSNSYLEVVPVYNEANKLSSGDLVDADPKTAVKGMWTTAKAGSLPVVFGPNGRVLISKTLGNENSTTTVTTIVPGEGQAENNNNQSSTGIDTGENPEANPGPLHEAQPGNDNTPNAGPNTPGGPNPTGPGTPSTTRPGGPTPTTPNTTTPPTTVVVTTAPPTLPPITVTIPPTTKPPTTTIPKTPPSSQPVPPTGY